MKPPLTVTLDREKLNHPVHEKEEKSTKERRDKEMRKLRKNEGFTLAELLIVVAIIAVLVAVSIPIFTRQLEKSRESTDKANIRAAKAAVVTAMLDDISTSGTVYYDAVKGVVTDTVPSPGYGKGTAVVGNSENTNASDGYDAEHDYAGGYLVVEIKEDATSHEVTGTITWAGCKAAGDKLTVGGNDVFSAPTPAAGG